MTEHFIHRLQETKDFNSFQEFVKSLDNINKNLIQNEDNSLNLLHICIGLEESEFMLKCVQYLLSEPDININSLAKIDGTLGISGAHIAVEWTHYNVLKLLIDFGIDLFICDSYGLLAIDYAIERDDERAGLMIKDAVQIDLSSKINSLNFYHRFHDTKSDIKDNTNKCKEYICELKSKETDSEKTIDYFDENHSLLRTASNKSNNSCDSSDCSENTLISNISYEKTKSVKSFYSDKTEIYVYNDRDHNVVLIEERFEGCPNDYSSEQREVISKGYVTQNDTDIQLNKIEVMNETQIFNELRAMGDSPGPIVQSTKKYYAKRLLDLRIGHISPNRTVLPLPNHSLELNLLLKNEFPFEGVERLETQFIDLFKDNDFKQNNFIYLLIDPNITENIPLLANKSNVILNNQQINTNLFKKFIKSIFYVGKGQGNRVYQHFYEAIKSENSTKISPKVNRIHDIWSSNKGVVSLHCFNGISSSEALARETLIIEALVLSNLTNQVNGHYSTIRRLKWNEKKRRLFGSYLLYKSFGLYVLTGERQIRRPVEH